MEFKDVLLHEAIEKEKQAEQWRNEADAAEENARHLRQHADDADEIAANFRRVAENEPSQFNFDDIDDEIPF